MPLWQIHDTENFISAEFLSTEKKYRKLIFWQ